MPGREGETSEGDAADGETVGVWMDGRGQIKGGRRRRRERCPVRRWLFRTARCQLVMTELKPYFCHENRLRGAV